MGSLTHPVIIKLFNSRGKISTQVSSLITHLFSLLYHANVYVFSPLQIIYLHNYHAFLKIFLRKLNDIF